MGATPKRFRDTVSVQVESATIMAAASFAVARELLAILRQKNLIGDAELAARVNALAEAAAEEISAGDPARARSIATRIRQSLDRRTT
jgi:hypothetical protein